MNFNFLFFFILGTPALDRVIQSAIEYCRQRKTFDKSLIDNQYVYYRFAELQADVECLRALNYRAVGN